MGCTQLFLNIDILKIKFDLRNRHTRLGLLAIFIIKNKFDAQNIVTKSFTRPIRFVCDFHLVLRVWDCLSEELVLHLQNTSKYN